MHPLSEGRDTEIAQIPINNSHAAKWMGKKNQLEAQRRSSPLVDAKEFGLRKGDSHTSSTSEFRGNPKGKVIAEQMLHATKDQEEYFNNKKVMTGGKDPKKKLYKEQIPDYFRVLEKPNN